jgi:hypothetical protein
MDWIRKNPVLTAIIAVTLSGCGALGYLILTAQGKYASVRETYDRQSAELSRLQGLKPYPEQANLHQMAAQTEEYAKATKGLLERLSMMELPAEPMTPEQFQDKLKRAVTDLAAKATTSGTKLPPDFFLGFEDYRTQLPTRDAAPQLGRQMAAVELVCNLLVDSKVAELKGLKRAKLPVETGEEKKDPKESEKPKPGAKGAGPAKPAGPTMIEESEIALDFISDQNRFRRVLNLIAAAKEQFFIVRNLVVANEKQTAPPRTAVGTPPVATPPPPIFGDATGTPGSGPTHGATAPKLEFLLGNERVEIKATVAIVDFADPSTVKFGQGGGGGDKKQATPPQK